MASGVKCYAFYVNDYSDDSMLGTILAYYVLPYKYDIHLFIRYRHSFILSLHLPFANDKVTMHAKDDNDEDDDKPHKRLALTTQINNMRSTKSNKPKCDFFLFTHSLPLCRFHH